MACKYCGSDMHTSLLCFERPRTPMQSKRKLMNRVGPVTAKWIETRHEWIQANPPDEKGEWNCYLPIHHPQCPRKLNIYTLTLDHKKSRSRHPELRFDLSNLGPASAYCNTDKGSKSPEEYTEWLNQKLAL